VFLHSRFIENPSVGSWETNPYFFKGVLLQKRANKGSQWVRGMTGMGPGEVRAGSLEGALIG
jgi:hypothetical protein